MIRTNDNGRKRSVKRKALPVKYSALLTRGNEGGFVAMVPVLPGCVSQGRTRRDALKNVREAAEAYVEALLEDGLSVPRELGSDLVEFEVFPH